MHFAPGRCILFYNVIMSFPLYLIHSILGNETNNTCVFLLIDGLCPLVHTLRRGRRGRMVVGFTTAYVISAYHHYSCEFLSRSQQGTPVSATNKTVRHDITEILLKVPLNTSTLASSWMFLVWSFTILLLCWSENKD